MKTIHKITIGDSRQMDSIQDNSIHLIITSPPYWQLKDYGHKEQIGFDDSYESYINNLNLVWQECERILSPGCRLCINIGDQFARAVYYGRYKVIPIRTEIIKFCEIIGLDYMGAVIWQKVTTTNTTGGASIMGSFPYPRNGILKIDYEFILIFKKLGQAPKPTPIQKEKSKLTIDEWNEYFAGHWNFNGEKQSQHLAMFPEELPKRLIKMFSFVGDTVMDPFLGSGTTSLAAINLNRNSIGYEINDEFLPIIKSKLGYNESGLFEKSHTIKIEKSKMIKLNLSEKIKELPYIFRDVNKIDKKIDPRKLAFGSKINGKEVKSGDFRKVAQIVGPNYLILDNGIGIKLIGVEPISSRISDSISFLNDIVLNKDVVLKFDENKYDEGGNLLVYLYLKNKTFVNARLIKAGLVLPSTNYDYKYIERFTFYSPLIKKGSNAHS